MSQLNTPHDHFFKAVFGRSEVACEFLQRYLPQEVVALVDWPTLQPEKDHFVDTALQEHASDLLYSVQLYTGEPASIYLLFEHKSYLEYRINLDLMRYRLRIWEHWRNVGHEGKLPVIFPLLFYHGPKPWNITQEFAETVADVPALKAYIPHVRYYLVDLSRYSDEEIKGAVVLRVALLILKYIYHNELRQRLPGILSLLVDLTQESSGLDFIHSLLRYLTKVTETTRLTFEELQQAVTQALHERSTQPMATIADYLIEQGMERGIQKGREEGREEGMQLALGEGERRILKKQIQLKFGKLPAWVEERLAEADSEQLEAWSMAILTAESLERLFDEV